MNLRSAIVLMMAAMGMSSAARSFGTRKRSQNSVVGHTGRASVNHKRRYSNQRQIRKDRRRRHAAGDKKAFA